MRHIHQLRLPSAVRLLLCQEQLADQSVYQLAVSNTYMCVTVRLSVSNYTFCSDACAARLVSRDLSQNILTPNPKPPFLPMNTFRMQGSHQLSYSLNIRNLYFLLGHVFRDQVRYTACFHCQYMLHVASYFLLSGGYPIVFPNNRSPVL